MKSQKNDSRIHDKSEQKRILGVMMMVAQQRISIEKKLKAGVILFCFAWMLGMTALSNQFQAYLRFFPASASEHAPTAAGQYDLVQAIGNNTVARRPRGIAIDPVAGKIYISDDQLDAIFVTDDTGNFTNRWGVPGILAGQFASPHGIVVNGSGYIYVVDSGNSRVQIFDPSGEFVKSFGAYGSETGCFRYPWGITINSSGALYVTDFDMGALDFGRVQVFDASGNFLYNFGEGILVTPYELSINSSGNIYVADYRNHTIKIFSPQGNYISCLGTLGQPSPNDGQFNFPTSVQINNTGFVYVADNQNNRIQIFTPTGIFVEKWVGGTASFNLPMDLAINISGEVYVTDYYNSKVYALNPSGTLLAEWGVSGKTPGQFFLPCGVATNSSKFLYVADSFNRRIQIFNPTGEYLTSFDTGTSYPVAVVINDTGSVYVASGMMTGLIQVYSPTGSLLTEWGMGQGYSDFWDARGIACNSTGYIYITDAGNNRVQVFTPEGTYVTKWGTIGEQSGNFSSPRGIAVNATGYVFVADTGNCRVQVFTAGGAFVTQWGTSGTLDGQFLQPEGIAVSSTGLVYITDAGAGRVQVFTSTGQFIEGWGTTGWHNGQFLAPKGIALDLDGHVWVSEFAGCRAQEFIADVLPRLTAPTLLSITPNPSMDGNFTLDWTASIGATAYAIYRSNSVINVPGDSVTWVANVSGTTYRDTIANSGTYYYVVVAFNQTDISSYSNCLAVQVTIQPSENEPDFPLGLVLGITIPIGIAGTSGMVLRRKRQRRNAADISNNPSK